MGMPSITFRLELFSGSELSRKRSQKCLLWLLEALCKCNELWLRTHPGTPTLYKSKVIYEPERKTEIWQDIPHVLEMGKGDCEDLACYRIAELRAIAGIKARPFISWRKVNNALRYHALVVWPDGRVEDPSLALGMKGHDIVRRPVFVSV